jgi:hypothetical protein
MAGYSGTTLAKKLGIKEGFRVRTTYAPEHYRDLIGRVSNNIVISNRIATDIDMWHLFTTSATELGSALRRIMGRIKQNGMIWVSWPKKSAKISTDVTEDTVRKLSLPLGLVDVKVCAVDEVWSGLKLVIRKELRK